MTSEDLLKELMDKDIKLVHSFVDAPASTKWHGSHKGGLLEHSMHVVDNLLDWRNRHPGTELTEDDCVICGMLHDLCKTYLYKWNKQENKYEYNSEIVKSHAKLSIEMIEKLGIKLTTLQRVLILLHMSSWSNPEDFAALTEDDKKWLYTSGHILLLQAMNWADMKASENERVEELEQKYKEQIKELKGE